MHRSVENAVPLVQHPVSDASLPAAFGGIFRERTGYALRLIFGWRKRCFISADIGIVLLSNGPDRVNTTDDIRLECNDDNYTPPPNDLVFESLDDGPVARIEDPGESPQSLMSFLMSLSPLDPAHR